MTEPPREWDKELSAIDKAIEKQGSGAPVVGPAPGVPTAPAERPAQRGAIALTWLWVALAVALGVGLAIWPYQHDCGLQAAFYLAAAGVTAILGAVAAASSWHSHRGFAHLLSLLVIGWAAVVAAGEVLPRIGYARESRSWMCPAAPEPAPTQPAPTQPAPTQPAPTQPAPTQPVPAEPAPGTGGTR